MDTSPELRSPSANSNSSRVVAPSVHTALAMGRAELDFFSSAAKLSPELVCHVARFLPYRDAWIAASVCGAWRASLLADPFLWSHISVHLEEKTFGAWLSTLQTLIKRNAQRPLTLELKCDECKESGELFNALEVVAAYLAGHMEVIKSLSITIPSCNTKYWHRLLRKRAPLLEVLRIHNNTFMDDTPKLPSQLFGGYAPRLCTVVLEQAYFPDDLSGASGRALAGVTSLSFHTSGSIEYGDVLEDLALVMPRLSELTLTGTRRVHGVVLLPSRAGPPRERRKRRGVGREELDIVEEAIRSESQRQPITTVDIAWTPLHANVLWLADSKSERYLSLSLNGHRVIVDIQPAMLCSALTPRAIAHFSRSVQTLAIVEEMWDFLKPVDMPALRDLTFRLLPRDDWTAAGSLFDGAPAARQYNLEALRLIRPPEQAARAQGTVVPRIAIANLLGSVAAAGSSPTLYLYGLSFDREGNNALGDTRIVHEAHLEEPAVQSWSWELTQDKMVVPRAV